MARRGNSEGSIYYQEARQRWVGAVSLADGKRKYVYGKTRQDVAKKVNKALDAREKGLPATDDRITVAQHLTTWLDAVVKPSVRPWTYASYEGVVRIHLIPAFGKRRLNSLTPSEVQQFMSESWASQKWSARTINYWRRVLSLALGHAVTTGKIARNVAGRGMVKPVKGPARQIQPLEPEQVSAFVEATRGRSMEHMFMLDLCTGLREGELLGLRWSDVDQVGGWLTIRQELVWLNRRPYAFQEPKSEAGMRQVPLVPQAIAALRAQKARVAELELHCPPGAWTDHDLVFPSEVGTPIHPGNVNREFKKVLKVAGLPAGGFRPHDLRHGMATHLLEAGVDARIVMQLMGWSQSSMLKRYQHVRTAALNDARERLGGRLASIPGLAASGS